MNRLSLWLSLLLSAAAVCFVPAFGADRAANLDLARQLNDTFVEVAGKVSPAVVVISVIEKPNPKPDPDEDENFDSLPPGWRDFHRQFRNGAPERSLGQGSGIIIRKNGYILTNRHVVEEAETINVRLQDGRRFKAVLRGTDLQSDVAVIKIDADSLPTAVLADSSKTRVGEFAIAIGAPFSLDYSVTFGHVSAKGRNNVIEGYEGASLDQDFIQTDAQINPGNSGGPLINIEGEVIGINTLIRGLHTGIGFAIPSTLAKEVSEQLIATGKFVRPWLGVAIQALRDQPELRDALKGVEDGVVVSRVLPEGPAAKSDLRPSDIITAVDGTAVATPQQLRTALRPKPIGKPIVLDVFRKGKTIQLKLSPAEWVQQTPQIVKASAPAKPKIEPAKVGLTVQALTAELATKFGVEANQGVLVSGVEKNSIAAREGLKAGDIITSLNQQSVASAAEFQEALKQADLKKGLLLNIVSQNNARFVVLKQD